MKILVLLLLSTLAFAAKTDLKTEADKTYTAGDVIRLEVEIPEGGVGAAPDFAEKLKLGPVELGNTRVLWQKEENGKIVFGVTSYTPGAMEVPAIKFMYGGKVLFESEPKTAMFGQVEGDKQKDDIYQPSGVTMPLWMKTGIGIIALLLASLFGWLGWRAWKKFQAAREAAKPKVELTPIEVFENRRVEIDRERWLDREAYKKHYFALSDAAKAFLSASWHFDAEEKTTRELSGAMLEAGLAMAYADRWRETFEEMDVVKFTDIKPEVENAMSISKRLSELANSTWRGSPEYREWQKKQQILQQKEGVRA